MKLVCLFCLLAGYLAANSITITGACQQNCTTTFNDQYGEFWSYVQVNITDTDSSVSGLIYTDLGFTNANVYNNPGATGQTPDVSFIAILDIPVADPFLDISTYFLAQNDEGDSEYNPTWSISGVGNLTPVDLGNGYFEYDSVPNPGQIIVSGEVSTQVQMSWDRLGFEVSYTDPETAAAPEPSYWILGMCMIGVLYAVASRVSTKSDK